MVKVDDAELARTRINRLLDRTYKPGKLTLTIVARPK